MPGSLVAANHELACTTLLCARDACGEDAASLTIGIWPRSRWIRRIQNSCRTSSILCGRAVQRVTTPLSGADLTQQQQILRQAIRRAGEP